MAFGTLVKDFVGIPIPQGYVPGDAFRALQSSLLKNTDASSNVSTPVVMSHISIEAVLNGQAYAVVQTATIGSSAQGQFAISLFNPSGSSKNVLITSIKSNTNFGITTTYLYQTTADPAYNTSLTAKNMSPGGAASALAGHITANSASVSFPGSGNFEVCSSAPEMISNNMMLYLPANNGLTAVVFVGNSQQYALNVKWIEF